MNQARHFTTILVATLGLLFSAACLAADPSGVWTSSSGNTIQVWSNMQQVNVTITSPNGKTAKYNGWWTRFGDKFDYQGPQGVSHASFQGSNQIHVTSPNGSVAIWTRGQHATRAQPGNQAPGGHQQAPTGAGSNITGLWRSSSGSSVQVSSQGAQVFVTLVSPSGQRYQGSGRWLQAGRTFDYSYPGETGVHVGTVVNQNQINVASPGNRHYTWTRSGGTASANTAPAAPQPMPNRGSVRESSRDVPSDPTEFLNAINRNMGR